MLILNLKNCIIGLFKNNYKLSIPIDNLIIVKHYINAKGNYAISLINKYSCYLKSK